MKELWKSLRSVFEAGTIGSSMNFWVGAAPQGEDPPYAVATEITDVMEETWSSDISNVHFQVALFDTSDTPSTVEGYYANLQTAFNDASMSISGQTLIRLREVSSQLIRDPEMNYWQKVVEYLAEIQ